MIVIWLALVHFCWDWFWEFRRAQLGSSTRNQNGKPKTKELGTLGFTRGACTWKNLKPQEEWPTPRTLKWNTKDDPTCTSLGIIAFQNWMHLSNQLQLLKFWQLAAATWSSHRKAASSTVGELSIWSFKESCPHPEQGWIPLPSMDQAISQQHGCLIRFSLWVISNVLAEAMCMFNNEWLLLLTCEERNVPKHLWEGT